MDYKELEGITNTAEDSEFGHTTQPLGLFYVKSSGDLVPIAIQLFQQPSDTNPIWTPDDSQYDWLLAKMWLRHADYQVQQVFFLPFLVRSLQRNLFSINPTPTVEPPSRPSIVHYASRASVVVFVCTGARLLLFSGVLLFSLQALNCVERNYYVSYF